MTIHDVSIPIQATMPVWPGQLWVDITPIVTVAKDGASVSKVTVSSHSGTHVDAPAHFLEKGTTVDQLNLTTLIGKATVYDLTTVDKEIGVGDVINLPMQKGDRVLFKTTNSTLLKDEFFHNEFIYLTADAAKFLVAKEICLVGTDYLGIEKRGSPGHPVHKTLLSANIIIIEGLNLSDIVAGEYMLYCLPLKITGCDGAPARVVLIKE